MDIIEIIESLGTGIIVIAITVIAIKIIVLIMYINLCQKVDKISEQIEEIKITNERLKEIAESYRSKKT